MNDNDPGENLRLTFGPVPGKKEKLAIITRGGHPQIPDSGQCEVLTVEKCKNMSEAKKWFRRMKIERPWETRQ